MNINFSKINVNDIVLVFGGKVPKHFWRIAKVAGVLPSRDSEIRGAIVKIAETNTILKRAINKLFTTENTYDTNQTDKAREQKLRRKAAVLHWANIGEKGGVLNIANINLLIRFNKKGEIFPNVTQVLSIPLKTAATSAIVERANFKERVAYWLATCVRKPKVSGLSRSASYAQR